LIANTKSEQLHVKRVSGLDLAEVARHKVIHFTLADAVNSVDGGQQHLIVALVEIEIEIEMRVWPVWRPAYEGEPVSRRLAFNGIQINTSPMQTAF